jgi:hypothetical protein
VTILYLKSFNNYFKRFEKPKKKTIKKCVNYIFLEAFLVCWFTLFIIKRIYISLHFLLKSRVNLEIKVKRFHEKITGRQKYYKKIDWQTLKSKKISKYYEKIFFSESYKCAGTGS